MDKLAKSYLSNLKMQAEAVVSSCFKHDFLHEIYFIQLSEKLTDTFCIT